MYVKCVVVVWHENRACMPMPGTIWPNYGKYMCGPLHMRLLVERMASERRLWAVTATLQACPISQW